MNLVKKIMPFAILVGLVSLVLVGMLEQENSLITVREINGMSIYVFNLNEHLQYVQNVYNEAALQPEYLIPTRQWVTATTIEAFSNNMLVIFQWLYMPINLVLYVVRITAWCAKILLALMGFSVNSDIIQLQTWIITDLQIPYF